MKQFFPKTLLLAFLIHGVTAGAQDLDSLLNSMMAEETVYTMATFKSTRIMNGHSIERMREGSMDFRISHRFGTINSGAYEFFGLDVANIHLGLEYGITDWVMIGIGRGTFEKTVDGFSKFSILRQSSGSRNMPVSVSYLASLFVNGLRWPDPELDYEFKHRLSYVHQVMIGRKFSPGFSLQVTPSYLHQNLVAGAEDPNDIFAIGAGTRIKLTNRISFNAEYFYLLNIDSDQLSTPVYDPLSLGFDIETGGHVFQIVVTNSVGMREHAFLGHTTGRWLDGDIHLGFNVSRVFQLKK
jgi:opacity protein-like surface antigen